MSLKLRHVHAEGLPNVRELLVDLYLEIYGDERDNPFYARERIEERLDIHASCDEWKAVIGYNDGEIVGYAYAARLPSGSGWWNGTTPALPPEFCEESGNRTVALFELMVRKPWRKTGAAQCIHDDLLAARDEERATLLVDTAHPKAVALYECWGYEAIGTKRPFTDSPTYAVMLKPLR
ncbi:GNAT family N-acetyltransferase [Streptomyces sp. NBC_01481]|uniref:GNAT family N-acetyltransferase n=1 Tax=Streptomyces sp. NBC_01481 TaxID=2975869 RepID=UPI0022535E1D|nr:GNAT family N-acetyltransferase [Streptomyces sp. NBC_01481]MCX4584704.1 GNAT family N-acetyltransferase [Streptomyces sp. NBC_01481]